MTTFTTLGKDEAEFQLALRFYKIEARLARIEAFLTTANSTWPMKLEYPAKPKDGGDAAVRQLQQQMDAVRKCLWGADANG